MAELDDFFAKKDKKKSKTKSKFVTADELVRNLEECTKREVSKPKKLDVAQQTAATAAATAAAAAVTTGGVAEGVSAEIIVESNNKLPAETVPEPVEEEWKEFEQEQRKDYSGLKIGQLTINEKQHQQQQQQNQQQQQQQQQHQQSDDIYDDEDEDSDGYSNDPNAKRSGHGPWKKLIPAEEVTQIPVPVETEKSSSKVYITPALRYSQVGSGMGGGGGSSSGGLRTRRAAPDITNTEFFPTLNAARPEEQRKKKNEPAFEEVRHGGRFQRVQQEAAVTQVAPTNRFQSLDDEADS